MKIIELFCKTLNHYESIDDLPAWNWFKINETDDISFMLHVKRAITEKEKVKLEEKFAKIYEEYMNNFGVSEMLKQVMVLKRDIACLRLEMIIHDDASRQTLIDIKEAELVALVSDSEKQSTTQVKAYVEKYMGFYIDERKVSVRDYYSYIELLKKEVEAQEKNNLKNG